MARPKKTELSPQVGTVNAGRKRGNPDFVSSSFYVPKQVNIRFDRALLTLKANGFDVDRSDILSALMDRFATAVDAAEQQGGGSGLDLEAILATAADHSVQDSADVSVLKTVMRASIDEMKADSDRVVQQLDELKEQYLKLVQSSAQQG
jgi:hypothetical protein